MLVRAIRSVTRKLNWHYDPAVGQGVIEHHGIAVIIRRVGDPHHEIAHPAYRRERSARLVINPHAQIGGYEVMVRAHRAVCIRRSNPAAEDRSAAIRVHPIKVCNRRRDHVGVRMLIVINGRIYEREQISDEVRLHVHRVLRVLLSRLVALFESRRLLRRELVGGQVPDCRSLSEVDGLRPIGTQGLPRPGLASPPSRKPTRSARVGQV